MVHPLCAHQCRFPPHPCLPRLTNSLGHGQCPLIHDLQNPLHIPALQAARELTRDLAQFLRCVMSHHSPWHSHSPSLPGHCQAFRCQPASLQTLSCLFLQASPGKSCPLGFHAYCSLCSACLILPNPAFQTPTHPAKPKFKWPVLWRPSLALNHKLQLSLPIPCLLQAQFPEPWIENICLHN